MRRAGLERLHIMCGGIDLPGPEPVVLAVSLKRGLREGTLTAARCERRWHITPCGPLTFK